MKTGLTLLIPAWLVLLSGAALANDIVVEAYGDSLTAGFLAKTSITQPPPLAEVSHIVNNILMYGLSHDYRYMKPLHAPELAWPNRFVQQMAKRGQSMTLVNRAVTGARTADLMSEIEGAPAVAGKTIGFFFIGHNDLPRRHDSVEALAALYRTQLDQALAAWDTRHRGGIAYLLPVGEVADVYHLLKGFVWHETDHGRYSCENSWDLFAYGSSYAALLKAGTLDAYVQPRVEAMHTVEDQLALEWDKRSARDNHFRYLADVEHTKYQREYFAVDCFHLSPQGEAALGEIVAKAVDPRDWQ